MAKTFFLPRTPITANWLNAVNNPRHVGNPEADGELPLIVDADMTSAEGQLKSTAYRYIDGFAIGSITEFDITIIRQRRQLSNGQYQSAGTTVLTLPANADGEIWLNWLTGQLQIANFTAASNLRNSSSYAIFTWSTNATQITSLQDVYSRSRSQDMPASQMLQLFGGRSLIDQVWTANTTVGNLDLSQPQYGFNNLTINLPQGAVALRFQSNCLVQVAGDLTINGCTSANPNEFSRIEMPPTSFGAGMVYSNSNSGSIHYNGLPGDRPSRLPAVPWSVQESGSPGAGANVTIGGYAVVGGNGGAGGGRLHFQVAGRVIINGRVRFQANGGNGGLTDINFGQNGPSNDRVLVAGGGGGGSGGLILIQCGTSIRHAGTTVYRCRGGVGGDGFAAAAGAYAAPGVLAVGGGGGGGGWAVEEAPTIIGLATYELEPGDRGGDIGNYVSNASTFLNGGGTGSGFGGSGGIYFVNPITTPVAGDIQLPYPGTAWWYRPARVGSSARALRFPITF